MKRRLSLASVALIALLLCAATWTELYLQQQNSLLQNGQWVTSKQRMQLHLVGALEFQESRQALARNQLNLGAWSGFHEILLNRVDELRSLSLRFRLAENAHLSVLFGRGPDGYAGVRLSRHPAFESRFFRAKPDGEFTRHEAFDPGELGSGWNALRLEISERGVDVSLNGRPAANFESSIHGPQTLGFRSGAAPVSVDDVRAVFSSGETFSESFRYSQGAARALVGFGCVFLLLGLAVAGLSALARRNYAGTRAVFAFAAVNAVACIVGLALLAADHLYWSSAYFYKTPGIRLADAEALPLAVEEYRAELFGGLLPRLFGDSRAARIVPEPLVEDSLVRRGRPARGPSEEYSLFAAQAEPDLIPFDRIAQAPRKRRGVFRIVFVGSSQTWGAGAESSADTFVARSHRLIDASLEGRIAVETINLSINGSTSETQLPRYQQASKTLRPDLLVLNFSNNDRSPELLAQNVRAFLDWNAARGIATILVLEANSIERSPSTSLERKHEVLRKLGAAADVPVLDLHAYVNSPELVDSGFLWWDYVHFSSYGHRCVAEWLAPQIVHAVREQLRARAARQASE